MIVSHYVTRCYRSVQYCVSKWYFLNENQLAVTLIKINAELKLP